MELSGQIVDIFNKRIYSGKIILSNGKIKSISEVEYAPSHFILPGFIDAHVHVESSMLVPSEFARLAVVHGTVATVSDPHEIGNVMGVEGVEYMINNGNKVPFKFYFGAPSCVPATPFETAGAEINVEQVEYLLDKPEIKYLAEMMNWPGVLNNDPMVNQKIKTTLDRNKVVDGHAPGLKGEQARKYAAAGITTDHECFTSEEARDKLKCGMKVIVREGSAAKNFEALIDLMHNHSDQMMFCSDDKHSDNLVEGHINQLASRAVERRIDIFKVLKAACINPVEHYKLDVGQLREGDAADFIVVSDLQKFEVLHTFIDGQLVAENGKSLIDSVEVETINNFHATPVSAKQFSLKAKGEKIRVIVTEDGQLITKEEHVKAEISDSLVISDLANDILKMAVINRYEENTSPAVAFIKNVGLKEGAIASSVGHDSHNILVVGVDDESMARAANLIIKAKGGVSAVSSSMEKIVELPVAGIMSAKDGYEVAEAYKSIDQMAKRMGSTLNSPYMTLSFMALLVIPQLKLSDKGLFDGDKFRFVDNFC